jgi:hypothetical protein
VFTCATFSIVFVNHQCPRLAPSFKSLRDAGDGILFGLEGVVVMIEGDVHVSAFIVDGLGPGLNGG